MPKLFNKFLIVLTLLVLLDVVTTGVALEFDIGKETWLFMPSLIERFGLFKTMAFKLIGSGISLLIAKNLVSKSATNAKAFVCTILFFLISLPLYISVVGGNIFVILAWLWRGPLK